MNYSTVKRLFDLIGVVLGLSVVGPLLVIVTFAVLLASGKPILYRGVRAGLNNDPFVIYKFRTMVPNAEMLGGPSTALDDHRLTRIGGFLRKYKLDELPQLFNVLKGDMSLVGPRPQVLEYTNKYDVSEMRILSVKPGLTDYASIKFIDMDAVLGKENVDVKYALEVEPIKNQLRLQYVDDVSFLVDVKILFLTLLRLLRINIDGIRSVR